ncbi:hypothetical protein CSC70_06300 [Pseudoxanthomonas kalamensis DSM 18571]|uniref:phage tail terminator-like protein n=1 Tax=Pseudoxanthomonas kalamensis TaxID=289483 RepID=UPI0013910175|nr:phage tail terminator-like protein [Pseudoxanthomonas kalamensis]KAF1710301.1 hypothetical protein CSC70_06300 [Pseudoxanthomonas kalamensis DSM 18571]
MSESSIDRALEVAAVAALGPTFTGRIAAEGFTFTPPTSGSWAQLTHLPAGAAVSSLGVNGMDEHVGVYQIDVSVPEVGGNPRADLLAVADTVRAYFVAGREFTHLTQGVRVVRAERSQIRRVDGWQRISVSVTYSAFSIRPSF